MRDDDQAWYALATIDRLIEGWVWFADRWIEAPGSYQAWRSRLETVGDVDEEYACEVMDLDRALLALRRVNPTAAMLVTLVRDGWELDEINDVFGHKLRTPAAKLIDKATCFLAAYLNGATATEAAAAYRRGRRPLR